MDNLNGLSPEQQALFASIMGNSSQSFGFKPAMSAAPVTPTPAAAPAPAPAADMNSNRVLSQAEIDALFASMGS